jgi:predicted GNAT family N-acyltransferase
VILIQSWQEASKRAYAIRQAVFIEEQRIPQEMDALAFTGNQCIGTGRLVEIAQNAGQIGRMAVLRGFRGDGVGKAILMQLINLATSQKMSSVSLHSQVSAIPFYEKVGFKTQGSVYEEAGIPHRNMMLILPISS